MKNTAQLIDDPTLGADSQEKLLEVAREVLHSASAALDGVARLLDFKFVAAVKLLADLPHEARLVLSGIGKAGLIAQKISATFASIGLPSFFLHPTEALHGDLGRYGKNDISIILSNSGETPEIIKTLPHLKRLGVVIICLTACPTSTLASHSDITLSIGKFTEAGPLGLAPTTSTTAMLALGDALAMAVLALKPISTEDFARYHPGGNIGKSLILVSQIMRRGNELCIVNENMTTREVIHCITCTKGRPGAACVVNEQGYLTGSFTDGDLRRCLEMESEFLDKSVMHVMGRSPKTIEPKRLAEEALHVMSEYKIDQIIIVDQDNRPVGMLDIQDLVLS